MKGRCDDYTQMMSRFLRGPRSGQKPERLTYLVMFRTMAGGMRDWVGRERHRPDAW